MTSLRPALPEGNRMSYLEDAYWTFFPDGTAKQPGIDHGSKKVRILAENKEFVALKFSGTMYWSSIGRQGYAPPRITVYRVKSKKDNKYTLQEALEWSTGRRKIE